MKAFLLLFLLLLDRVSFCWKESVTRWYFNWVGFFASTERMALRRLVKQAKVLNKHMLLMKRREPYRPRTADRHMIENRTRLEEFERRNAEGVMFVPDAALPPWKRSVVSNLRQTHNTMNFRGLRVRAVDRQDEPGFPTHFR